MRQLFLMHTVSLRVTRWSCGARTKADVPPSSFLLRVCQPKQPALLDWGPFQSHRLPSDVLRDVRKMIIHRAPLAALFNIPPLFLYVLFGKIWHSP